MEYISYKQLSDILANYGIQQDSYPEILSAINATLLINNKGKNKVHLENCLAVLKFSLEEFEEEGVYHLVILKDTIPMLHYRYSSATNKEEAYSEIANLIKTAYF